MYVYVYVYSMGEVRDNDGYEEELVDYDEEEQNAPNSVSGKPNGESAKKLVSWNKFTILI